MSRESRIRLQVLKDPAKAFDHIEDIGRMLRGISGNNPRTKTDAEAVRDCITKTAPRIFTPENSYKLLKQMALGGTDNTGRLFALFMNWANKNETAAEPFFRSLIASIAHVPRPVNSATFQYHCVYCVTLLCNLLTLFGTYYPPLMPNRTLCDPQQCVLNLFRQAGDERALETLYFISNYCYISTGMSLQVGDSEPDDKALWFRLPMQYTEQHRALCAYCLKRTAVSPEFQRHQALLERYENELIALCQMIWEETTTQWLRQPRMGGLDWFTIPDYCPDIRTGLYYFLRENDEVTMPYVVSMRHWIDGTEWFVISSINIGRLDDDQVHDQNFAKYSSYGRDTAVLEFVLYSLAYHHLVCTPGSRGEKDATKRSATADDIRRIHETVRMHLRRLRPGERASEGRIAAALARGRALPQGFTLVGEFERDRTISDGITVPSLPTAPTSEKEADPIPLFSITVDSVIEWVR